MRGASYPRLMATFSGSDAFFSGHGILTSRIPSLYSAFTAVLSTTFGRCQVTAERTVPEL